MLFRRFALFFLAASITISFAVPIPGPGNGDGNKKVKSELLSDSEIDSKAGILPAASSSHRPPAPPQPQPVAGGSGGGRQPAPQAPAPGGSGSNNPPVLGPGRQRKFKNPKADAVRALSKKKGPKVPIACNNCRERKLKCNGQQPCLNCERRGVGGFSDCAYDPTPKRRGPGANKQ